MNHLSIPIGLNLECGLKPIQGFSKCKSERTNQRQGAGLSVGDGQGAPQSAEPQNHSWSPCPREVSKPWSNWTVLSQKQTFDCRFIREENAFALIHLPRFSNSKESECVVFWLAGVLFNTKATPICGNQWLPSQGQTDIHCDTQTWILLRIRSNPGASSSSWLN